MKKQSIVMAAAIIALALASSSASARVPIRVGGNFVLGFPIDEFKENVDETGVGLDAYAAFGIPNTPFHVGGSVGYMSQGSFTIERFVLGFSLAEIVTRNNVLSGNGFIRLQHTGSDFQPYVDGIVGFNRFFTTTELNVAGQVAASETDVDDWVLTYGLGGGAMFEVYESVSGGEREFSIAVDLGARYLIGGKADYVDIDSVDVVDDRVVFDTKSSRTDMVTVRIGASVLF